MVWEVIEWRGDLVLMAESYGLQARKPVLEDGDCEVK